VEGIGDRVPLVDEFGAAQALAPQNVESRWQGKFDSERAERSKFTILDVIFLR
jgi:hypothetical protein